MIKVVALNTPEPLHIKRFGFMAGQINAPDAFNTMDVDEIQELFEGEAQYQGALNN